MTSEPFPGFDECMRMMRDPDPLTSEEGFWLLAPHVNDHVDELIAERYEFPSKDQTEFFREGLRWAREHYT